NEQEQEQEDEFYLLNAATLHVGEYAWGGNIGGLPRFGDVVGQFEGRILAGFRGMRMGKIFLSVGGLLLVVVGMMAAKSSAPKVDAVKIREHVKYLSSDSLEGRGTGQKGGDEAADYI